LIYAGKAEGNCLIRNRQKAKATGKGHCFDRSLTIKWMVSRTGSGKCFHERTKNCKSVSSINDMQGNSWLQTNPGVQASTKEAGVQRLFDLISLFGEISAIETPRPFELFGVQFAQINQNGSI